MESDSSQRVLFRCSLFLHLGYVGAVAVAAGLIQFLADEAIGPLSLALVVFGGLLATASWRRAWAAVEPGNGVSVAEAHLRRRGPRRPFARSPSIPASR